LHDFHVPKMNLWLFRVAMMKSRLHKNADVGKSQTLTYEKFSVLFVLLCGMEMRKKRKQWKIFTKKNKKETSVFDLTPLQEDITLHCLLQRFVVYRVLADDACAQLSIVLEKPTCVFLCHFMSV